MKIYSKHIATAISDRSLHLIIMPTEACNFRCKYCYESFKIGKMHWPVVEGIKRLLSARVPGLDFLTISWFGGEPLLALDVMESISEHILVLTHLFSSIRYRADITTNAYLLEADVFRKLLAWNIRQYQISFDGPKELHDMRRIQANGRETFDKLWQNLKSMRPIDDRFSVTVRLHVDRDNFAHIPEFLAQFKRDFGDDSRFTLYVRELSRLAEPCGNGLDVFDFDEAVHAIESIRTIAEAEGISIRIPERKNHVCYAACYAANLNSFVIRPNGMISKCTVALDSDINDVGGINEDGALALDRTKLTRWARGLASGDTTELGCPMINIE